jgi:hypothetical protein
MALVLRARIASRSASGSVHGSTATSRPSLESLARYTSPMPPEPIGSRTMYGPRTSPARSRMGALYALVANSKCAAKTPEGTHVAVIGPNPWSYSGAKHTVAESNLRDAGSRHAHSQRER